MTGRYKEQLHSATCPQCNGDAIRKDWIELENFCVAIVYRCEDVYCSHVFVMQQTPSRILRPSKILTHKANIPLSFKIKTQLLKRLAQEEISTYFPVAIELSEDKSIYKIIVPDIEGCCANASTLENALKYAKNFICIHLLVLFDSGQLIPLCTAMENYCNKPEFKGLEWLVVDISQHDRYLDW